MPNTAESESLLARNLKGEQLASIMFYVWPSEALGGIIDRKGL